MPHEYYTKKSIYYQFKEYFRESDQIHLNSLFSDRDNEIFEVNDKETCINWNLISDILLILLLGIVLIKIKVFEFLFGLVNYTDTNSINLFFSTSVTVLGSILVLSFAILFFYHESNSKIYQFLQFNFFIRNKKVRTFLFIYIFTIIVSLLYLLTMPNQVLIIIGILFVLFSIVTLPVFIRICQLAISKKEIVEDLETNILLNIKAKQRHVVESLLQNLEALLLNSIDNRDRDLIKLTIDKLHDLAKFYVSTNWKLKHECLESTFQHDRISNSSDWFLREIMETYENAYVLLKQKKMLNYATYILNAVNSIGIKSLNYKDNHSENIIILKAYQNVILSSIKNDLFEEDISYDRLNNTFKYYLKHYSKIDERNFLTSMLDFFNESFTLEVLDNKPNFLITYISTLLWELHSVHSIEKPNEKNALGIAKICYTVLNLSNKLNDLGDFNGKINFLNQKLRDYLEEQIILCLMILAFHGHKDLVRECRNIYFNGNLINETVMLNALIKKIKTDYYVEIYFKIYNDEGDEKYFDKKTFIKGMELIKLVRDETKK